MVDNALELRNIDVSFRATVDSSVNVLGEEFGYFKTGTLFFSFFFSLRISDRRRFYVTFHGPGSIFAKLFPDTLGTTVETSETNSSFLAKRCERTDTVSIETIHQKS